MTVKELDLLVKTPMEIRSGFNGKVLCKSYREKKHGNLTEREVLSVWSEIRVLNGSGYDSFARPVICVHVCGDVEYKQSQEGKPHE